VPHPVTHRIICTAHDGNPVVVQPSQLAISYMTGGGGWYDPWIKQNPRGFLDEMVRRKTCHLLQKGRPVPSQDEAWKLVNGLQFGGYSTSEAWDAIRGHDAARYGTQFEVVHVKDLPDRWFRDAWRRSHNGGPVTVDLEKARQTQWSRIRITAKIERSRREELLEPMPPVLVDWGAIRSAIKHARDEEELRRIWPHELKRILPKAP
jgi:hypothetical protein